jgi:MFS family permease
MVMLKKILLVLNTLTFASTQILLFTLLPILAEKLSVSLSVIVGCFSLGSFLFLWGAPYWSSKSDKIGRDAVMNVGLAGLAVSFFILVVLFHFSLPMGETVSFVMLILSRVLYGSLASAIVPVAQLKNADLAKEGEHISGMFSHSLALNVGRSIGPLLLLLGKDHLGHLLLGIAAWSFSLLIMNFILSSQKLISENKNDSTSPTLQWVNVAKIILLPLAVTVLLTAYTGILHSSLGETLKKVFTLSGSEASTLMAQVLLMGSVAMVMAQVAGKILFKKNAYLAITVGFVLLLSGATYLAVISDKTVLYVAIVFISAGLALIYPAHLALVHVKFPKESMGRNIGILASGNTIGYALGGLLASLFLNYEVQKIALLIVCLLSLAMFLNISRMRE